MKRLFLLLVTFAVCAIGAFAQDTDSLSNKLYNQDLWKGANKEISAGYTTGSFDLRLDGGKQTSRWGASLTTLRNIYVHRGAIGGMLKFGIHIGAQINYMNFELGHGSLGDFTGGFDGNFDDDDEDEVSSLGKHYLAAGLALGPTATVMPFIWSGNRNLARLKLRAFFHVVPSYSAYITSDDEETDFHSAFCCYFAGGFNIIWRKLNVGVEWKSGRAKYKGLSENFDFGEFSATSSEGPKPHYRTNMFTVSLGLAF